MNKRIGKAAAFAAFSNALILALFPNSISYYDEKWGLQLLELRKLSL